MRALAPLCCFALVALVAGCGGDDGDSRTFGGDDTSGDAATTGDIAFSDTTTKDQAAPDAIADDVVPGDSNGPDVPACLGTCDPAGSRECVDDSSWRECEPAGACLAWSPPAACASGEVCQGGACVPDGPDCSGLPTGCDTPGAKRCSTDAKAVEECNGAYECPKWELLEDCSPGKPCVNGVCGGGVGPGACAELEACVDTACAEAVASGSNIKLLKCTLASCRTEYEGCLGPFGTGACKDLLKCAQSCPDTQCQKACTTTASYEANVQFVEVGACLEDNCPGALEDPMGNIACITGTCGTPLNACCGGSIMNCM